MQHRPKAFVSTAHARSATAVRRAVVDALRAAGIEPVVIEEVVNPGAAWANEVTDAIRRASVVIVDISDQSPNALYEVGYAQALRKPILLLVNLEMGRIPSQLAGFEIILYEESKVDNLADRLEWALSGLRLFADEAVPA